MARILVSNLVADHLPEAVENQTIILAGIAGRKGINLLNVSSPSENLHRSHLETRQPLLRRSVSRPPATTTSHGKANHASKATLVDTCTQRTNLIYLLDGSFAGQEKELAGKVAKRSGHE